MLIGNDNQAATDQRQHGMATNQTFPAFVLGMDGDRRIAEHGFRPCCRDGNEFTVTALDRIAEMPQTAIALA